MSEIKEKNKNLPQAPGVYFFKNEKGVILYIGKATSLRSRVQSYFRGDIVISRSQWIASMVAQVKNVDFQETESVLEALILESNLIKKHQPKYNTLEKDDKSFSYFIITKEEFPRVLIIRKTDLRKYVILSEAKNPRKSITNDTKNEILHSVQDDEIKKAEKLQYVFGPYTSKRQMEIALKIIRRIFPFHALKQKTEKGCLDFQLGKCPGPYAGAISKEDYKKNIRGIKMILEGKKKRLISTLEKEMHVFAKNNEFEKAAEARNKIFALEHIRDVALMGRDFDEEIGEKLGNVSLRIEAYDISNISGQHAVGSMVVFENGKPNKSQYRKFKINTLDESNDVGMMAEVLSRRFNNNWEMPDLILLDGGQGHLNMAEKLLHEDLGLAVNLVAVAKGPTRKKLDLRFAKNNANEKIKNILSDENLLKSIMDEAHRFAITFHRKVRRKNALS